MFFYKYIHFNDDQELQAISRSIIEDRKVMFPLTRNINDPNEFKFLLDIDKNNRLINLQRYFLDNPGKNENDYDAWINSWNSISQRSVSINARFELIQQYKVLSLSKTHRSNLLWSHYTKVHTGFCVIYTSKLREIVNSKNNISCGDVIYSDDVPLLKYLEQQNEETIKQIFYTKQKTWEYEKEYRFVVENNDNKPFFLSVSPDCIFGIILGSRMDIKNKKYLATICKTNNYKVYESVNTMNTYVPKVEKYDENVFKITSLM